MRKKPIIAFIVPDLPSYYLQAEQMEVDNFIRLPHRTFENEHCIYKFHIIPNVCSFDEVMDKMAGTAFNGYRFHERCLLSGNILTFLMTRIRLS